MYNRASWNFDGVVAEEFESHVRQNLPFYDELQAMAVSLSDYFVSDNSLIYDIGCGTAETIKRLIERHPTKKLQCIGVDPSTEMLEKAKEKTAHLNNVQFIPAQIESVDFVHNTPLIYSILTMHFLPLTIRQEVFKKVYDALLPGGAFILVDKVYASDAFVQHAFTHLQYEDKLSAGFNASEILLKETALRGVLQPLKLTELESLLTKIGFHHEIFFKHWQFTAILAVKPLM